MEKLSDHLEPQNSHTSELIFSYAWYTCHHQNLGLTSDKNIPKLLMTCNPVDKSVERSRYIVTSFVHYSRSQRICL